nr:bidirectional sugar transporter SWEET16-like [Ipomoea batatas]
MEESTDSTAGSSLHRCSQSPPGKTEMRKDVDCRRGSHSCSSLEEHQGRHCSTGNEPKLPPVEAARREPELPPKKKTFKHIVQKKSTENFKGIPYITTLLSTSLWAFYGLLMPGGLLVVTMNGTGVALHIIYVSLFLTYAPKNVRIQSLKMVGIIDVAFFGAVVAITLLALHGNTRLMPVGLLCTGLTIGMYASPFYEMV